MPRSITLFQHMTTDRKNREPARPDRRPMTARSVIASTLLGVDPPRLPALLLARSGELFGISEGTTRVALSRMVAAGELEPDDGGYRLAGRLLDRQERQRSSRVPDRRSWDGEWTMAVVGDVRRPAADRAALRSAMRVLRLAEHRESVWLRPDNLPDDRDPTAAAVVGAQCRRFRARPTDEPAAPLAARLWDLAGWADGADALRRDMAGLVERLEAGDATPLPDGFVLNAAVLRHLLADPLLPDELLPPAWPGPALRADYDRYDRAFKAVWRDWFRAQPAR
jgi:phenylacetic acid degradation operon negative regulatory protein